MIPSGPGRGRKQQGKLNMTTSIHIAVECDDDRQIRIVAFERGAGAEQVLLRNGDVYKQDVHEGLTVAIGEEIRPVLTEADADADLAGTPRPSK